MFTSLNKLKLNEIRSKINSNSNVIFLYRNTINRVISCFLNWSIRFPNNEQTDNSGSKMGWLMKILSNIDGFNYKLFVCLMSICTHNVKYYLIIK